MSRPTGLAALLLAAGVAAGCGQAPVREAAQAPQAAADKGGAKQAGQADTQRKIIHTAAVDVSVKDVEDAVAKARQAVAEAGGYVAKSEVAGTAGYRRTATLTARVPTDKFDPTVAEFGKLGVVTRSASDAQDVTEEFIDGQARLRNLKAEEQALNKLLDTSAGKLEDVLKIREHVVRVRSDIERVEGRLKYLTTMTDLATVVLTLREEKDYVPPSAPSFGGRAGRAFRDSADALVQCGENVALAAVAVVPWLPVILLAAGGVWAVRRWRRSARRG